MGKSEKISSREKLSLRESDDLFSEISWLESSLNFLKISPGCLFFLISYLCSEVWKRRPIKINIKTTRCTIFNEKQNYFPLCL